MGPKLASPLFLAKVGIGVSPIMRRGAGGFIKLESERNSPETIPHCADLVGEDGKLVGIFAMHPKLVESYY